ncbi:copper-binding protein [Undibacterium sp. TJN25]|uniref:copper-binding protein n=1 Tax=Undibacterium sp. TJN25 TaxID=3413056 RepID=UPI003BF41960
MKENTMNIFKTLMLASLLVTATHVASAAESASQEPVVAKAASRGLTEGEVRKIDAGAGKITLKHGDIADMDMPGMTMVFRVKSPAMLDKLKVGDKIAFRVEKADAGMVVTELELLK